MAYAENLTELGAAKRIDKNLLSNRWFFDLPENRQGRKIGDHYQASNPAATLFNDAFVLRDGDIRDGYYYIGDDRIEMEIVKKAASPKNKRSKKYTEHIIFPYAFDDQDKFQFAIERGNEGFGIQ